MLISSMGRYAVLILLDLAEHRGGFVPVRQIAERQELSQKYLERILRTLSTTLVVVLSSVTRVMVSVGCKGAPSVVFSTDQSILTAPSVSLR